MAYRILWLFLAAFLLTFPVQAADVKNCNGINRPEERMACLQKNIEALNDELRATAKLAAAAIPQGAQVQLQSRFSALNKCLHQPHFDAVNAVNCTPETLWRLDVKIRP